MSSEPHITTIDILRHGRTLADDILRGRIDVALSDEGYQQMQQRLTPLSEPQAPWEHIITSPLVRCAHFAQDLSAQHNRPVSIDHGFLEMDFGDWDGRSFDDLRQENPELFAKVWQQPDRFSPPNAEDFADFSQRLADAWQNMLDTHQGKHLLLICHGGVIRTLVGQVLDMPASKLSNIEVPYACLSRVKVYHQAESSPWPQLVFHNPH